MFYAPHRIHRNCVLNFSARLAPRVRTFVSVFLSISLLLMPFNKQREGLQVRKIVWKKNQMSDATYLDEAVEWSKSLTRMRARGPGDTENAMREIERMYGVDYWLMWRLRYRRSVLKEIGVSAYMRLKAAYQAECDRQLRKLQNQIARTEAIAGADSAAVGAAKALVGEGEE